MIVELIGFLKEYAMPLLAVTGAVLGLHQSFKNLAAKRREQAEEIAAWWVRFDPESNLEDISLSDQPSNPLHRFEMKPIAEPPRYFVGLQLVNHSRTPIYDLHVHSRAYVMKKGDRTKTKCKPILVQEILTPGEFISISLNVKRFKNWKTKRPWAYPENLGTFRGRVRPIINDPNWRVEYITFTDGLHRRWIRTADGRLRQLHWWNPEFRVRKINEASVYPVKPKRVKTESADQSNKDQSDQAKETATDASES